MELFLFCQGSESVLVKHGDRVRVSIAVEINGYIIIIINVSDGR